MSRKSKHMQWYKRDPRAFQNATIGWDEGLKGAYSTLLDLIYMTGGSLPDEAAYISIHIGCTKNKWTGTYRKQLLKRGKIEIKDGVITNSQASEAIVEAGYEVKEFKSLRKVSENVEVKHQETSKKEANFLSPKPTFIGDIDPLDKSRVDKDKIISPNGLMGADKKSDKRDFVQQVYSTWNGIANEFGLSKVKTNLPNAERSKSILRRLSECQGNEGLIFDALKNIQHNDHWIGRSKSQWFIKFDWVFGSPKNFRKVLEHEPVSQNIKNSNTRSSGQASQGLGGAVERSLEGIARKANESFGDGQEQLRIDALDIPAIFTGD